MLMFVFLCLYSFVPSFWTTSRHVLILLVVKNVLHFSRLKRRGIQSADCQLMITFHYTWDYRYVIWIYFSVFV